LIAAIHILVVGTGYVGLVTGTCLSEMGHRVTCLDIDEKKIEMLKNGQVPIYEPGLEEMIRRNVKAGRLDFTTSYADAFKDANVIFLCLPTPASEKDGRPNLVALDKALTSIAASIEETALLINKSTVPVGTTDKMRVRFGQKLKKLGKEIQYEFVSNPEFLKEGTAIADCLKPDRIVIGTDNEEARELMRRLYKPFNLNSNRIFFMDTTSAEMTKYAANAMLASRISFMNELSGICEIVGADINQVRLGIGSDKRIGYDFLYAGVGYGGSCFPKDLKGLISLAEDLDYSAPILNAIEAVNQKQKKVLARKLRGYFRDDGGLCGKTVAVWGVAFKPDTDDIREAPALELVRNLLDVGAMVRLYDPIAMENARKHFGDIEGIVYCESEYEAASDADAIALVTEWRQFRTVDFKRVRAMMRGNAIFDGRNQYDPAALEERGFVYHGIGIRKARATS